MVHDFEARLSALFERSWVNIELTCDRKAEIKVSAFITMWEDKGRSTVMELGRQTVTYCENWKWNLITWTRERARSYLHFNISALSVLGTSPTPTREHLAALWYFTVRYSFEYINNQIKFKTKRIILQIYRLCIEETCVCVTYYQHCNRFPSHHRVGRAVQPCNDDISVKKKNRKSRTN